MKASLVLLCLIGASVDGKPSNRVHLQLNNKKDEKKKDSEPSNNENLEQ